MNFFAYALCILFMNGLGHSVSDEKASFYESASTTRLSTVIENCDNVCFLLSGQWEVSPNIVWENFQEDLGGTRLTQTQFMEALTQFNALSKRRPSQNSVAKFVVLTEDEATEDARRDVQYFELKLKNILGTDQNVQKYLECCGAFQYDDATPLYVKSASSTHGPLEL